MSLVGSVLATAVSLRLLHCSMQRMIAIIRIVVRSNPIDAMRSSNIMLCFFYDNCHNARFGMKDSTNSLSGSAVDNEIRTRELLTKIRRLGYSAFSL